MSLDLNLKNISLTVSGHTLCQPFSLRLAKGSCTCLLGPSGVGKSSLLKAIAGIGLDKQTYYQGEIFAEDHQPLNGRIMMMSQSDGLLPWLNILDNVLIGYRLRNQQSQIQEQQAKALLIQVGLLEKDWHKKPNALSGGMRQRVALVRTVLEDKPLWLLDEPFSALDAITRYKLQSLVAMLWQDKTVLLVTHDPLEALRLADAIYVLAGSPARLEKVDLCLHAAAPRTLTTELLQKQAQIVKLLAGAADV